MLIIYATGFSVFFDYIRPMLNTHNEQLFLYVACILYAFSFMGVYVNRKLPAEKFVILFGFSGLILHAVSIAMRWSRTGHGPFINLYEILSSNVWSLFFCFMLFYTFFRSYRPVSQFIAPIIIILVIWLLLSDTSDTYLPPTYNTVWLYFHVFSGKIFLGFLLISTGLAAYALYTGTPRAVVSLAYKIFAWAFLFDSLMLLFGAIWAQDAWGRYWAWDPLETWAFMTWLAIVFVLHWRTEGSNDKAFSAFIIACFILAFLTFFGVPFISTAPHKGMI